MDSPISSAIKVNSIEVMIDLETLGLTANSNILSIGAVAFVRNWDDLGERAELNKLGHTFYIKAAPNLEDNRFSINQETLDWWNKPENAAAKAESFGGVIALEACLHRFAAYILDLKHKYAPDNLLVWSNGANFDLSMLSYAMEVFDIVEPWHYRSTRCYRTYMAENAGLQAIALANFPITLTGHIKHTALSDARYQARHMLDVHSLAESYSRWRKM